MTAVAVMGAGSWGTAFALTLCDAGNEVRLWARRPDVCRAVNDRHRNPDYFPDLDLPADLRATDDPADAMAGTQLVVLAVPSQTLRHNLAGWTIPQTPIVLSLAKGIELGTGRRMSQVITDVTGLSPDRVAVLTGPNLSHEIAARQPAASVIAASTHETAALVQKICHSPTFRPYTNTDVVGCELGGATKNVIALAVGMAVGLGFGDNATASVITRGLAEISRLGRALGADPHTFSGLAGMGDLVATCSSPLSRNRSFGEELGRGRTVAEISGSTRQVAEGVKSCTAIQALAVAHDVELPIVDAVVRVIENGEPPAEMVAHLLSRAARPERDEIA